MSEFFSARDFADRLNGEPMAADWDGKYQQIADVANSVLKAHLDGLPVVYGHLYDHGRIVYEEQKFWNDTHRARLWGIEEIAKPKCQHEPFLDPLLKHCSTLPSLTVARCHKCGKSLRAEWKEVE